MLNIDTGYKDGKSIFQFKFNKDLPGTNRWTHLHQQSKKHISATEFFAHGANKYVLDDTFWQINDELTPECVHRLIDYNNDNINNIYIQSNILLKFENVSCYNVGFLVEYDAKIYGCILIHWDEHCVNETISNVICKQCTLCGGGKFWPPIDNVQWNVEWCNDIAGDHAKLLPSYILNKTKIARLYDCDFVHEVGIVVSPLHFLWDGDNKHLYDLFGMAGSRSKYFCEYCLQTLAQMQSDPTPENRCTHTRTAVQIEQHALSVASNNKYNQDTHQSIKNQPLLFAGPWSLGLPVVHIIQGPAARLWTIIEARIRFKDESDASIKRWNMLSNKIDTLVKEIQQYKQTQVWMNIKDNHDIFDVTFVDELQSNLNKLTDQIHMKQQQLDNTKKELKQLESTLSKTSGEMEYLKLCDTLNIKPWHHKGDSMIGPSVKKYLYNWHTVIETLKNYDSECARLMEPCLARLCFLTKCIWTKNKEKFDDNCCYYLRFNLIEFDMLYHKLIRKYGGGVSGEKFGVKWHLLYHCVEWIEGLKWSPAHMDDQRIEAWNRHMEKYLTIFHCFGGQVNMKKMMDKIWRAFTLQ